MRFNTRDISLVSALQACVIFAEQHNYHIGEMWIEPRTGDFRIDLYH